MIADQDRSERDRRYDCTVNIHTAIGDVCDTGCHAVLRKGLGDKLTRVIDLAQKVFWSCHMSAVMARLDLA